MVSVCKCKCTLAGFVLREATYPYNYIILDSVAIYVNHYDKTEYAKTVHWLHNYKEAASK